jgi:5'-nucleotidase
MMSYAYDRFLPGDMTWRDLFDMVIVMARKPDFFSYNMSLYEVVTEDGLMRPVLAAKRGGLYCGGRWAAAGALMASA